MSADKLGIVVTVIVAFVSAVWALLQSRSADRKAEEALEQAGRIADALEKQATPGVVQSAGGRRWRITPFRESELVLTNFGPGTATGISMQPNGLLRGPELNGLLENESHIFQVLRAWSSTEVPKYEVTCAEDPTGVEVPVWRG